MTTARRVLVAALLALAGDPAQVAAQRAGFAEVLARLRAPEGLPSEAAAVAVLRVLEGRSIPHNSAKSG